MQNMVKTAKNVREEIVVPVSSPLRRRWIVGGVQTKPDITCIPVGLIESVREFQFRPVRVMRKRL